MSHQPGMSEVFIGPKGFKNEVKNLNSQNFDVQEVLREALGSTTTTTMLYI